MEKTTQMYEGKAKKVFATENPDFCIVSYKDDATAFNGLKKGTILGKGAINNRVTNHLMRLLEKNGVPTHLVEELNDRETLVKKVSIVPLEVIVRNIAAGSLSKRLGLPEGVKLGSTVLEYCFKNDDLGDPMVNDYHILAMGWATREELNQIAAYSFKVNEVLSEYLKEAGIELIDFKLEFGNQGRHHRAGRRDFPRHLPLLGQRDPRKAGQGPFPPGSGRRGRRLSGNPAQTAGRISI